MDISKIKMISGRALSIFFMALLLSPAISSAGEKYSSALLARPLHQDLSRHNQSGVSS
jgi:hypothetical protein